MKATLISTKTEDQAYSWKRLIMILNDFLEVEEYLVMDHTLYFLLQSRGFKIRKINEVKESESDILIALIDKPLDRCPEVVSLGKQFESAGKEWTYYSV